MTRDEQIDELLRDVYNYVASPIKHYARTNDPLVSHLSAASCEPAACAMARRIMRCYAVAGPSRYLAVEETLYCLWLNPGYRWIRSDQVTRATSDLKGKGHLAATGVLFNNKSTKDAEKLRIRTRAEKSLDFSLEPDQEVEAEPPAPALLVPRDVPRLPTLEQVDSWSVDRTRAIRDGKLELERLDREIAKQRKSRVARRANTGLEIRAATVAKKIIRWNRELEEGPPIGARPY